MAKAIALYEGGIHGRIERAVREDGQVFVRYQNKTSYGYRWTAWKPEGNPLGHNERNNPPQAVPVGFSTLYRRLPGDRNWRNVRLPNERV